MTRRGSDQLDSVKNNEEASGQIQQFNCIGKENMIITE